MEDSLGNVDAGVGSATTAAVGNFGETGSENTAGGPGERRARLEGALNPRGRTAGGVGRARGDGSAGAGWRSGRRGRKTHFVVEIPLLINYCRANSQPREGQFRDCSGRIPTQRFC
jgi:hypothetical protein